MTVIRSYHKPKSYTDTSNEVARNPNLSNGAIGLWVKCRSRPMDWKFHISELAKNGKDKRTAINSQIKELISENLCMRVQIRELSDSGKTLFRGVEYVFFPDKATQQEKLDCLEELKKCFPQSGFLLSEFLLSENQQLQRNDKEERQEDIIQRNDNDSVHKKIRAVKMPAAPIVHRSSEIKQSIVSPAAPIVSNLLDFNPEKYIMPNGIPLTRRCVNAFKKYMLDDKAKLLANVEYFEKHYHERLGNPEAYLQSCINRDYAKEDFNKFQNILFTQYIIEEYGLKQLNILQTVVKFGNDRNSESIKLNLPPESFGTALKHQLRKSGLRYE